MKYIFFDVDGTIVHNVDGRAYIPQSTKKTIQKLQDNGHFVAIASGRSMSNVIKVAEELNINNIVSDGGNGIMYKGHIIHIHPLEEEIKNQLSQELLSKHIPFAFMLDSTRRELMTNHQMLNYQENCNFEGIDIVIDDSFDFFHTDTFKIFMEIHKGDEDQIETVDAHKIMRYVDNCLVYEPDDKYKGAKELVELHHGNIKDMIFFGDGYNDVKMAEKMPMTIAMGNAVQDLKDVADFITKDIDQDGVEYACQYFQLI